MTRIRVLLAVLVTVLAVGCAAPLWDQVWLWLAYEEHEKDGVTYFTKRGVARRELSTESVRVLPQPCKRCWSSCLGPRRKPKLGSEGPRCRGEWDFRIPTVQKDLDRFFFAFEPTIEVKCICPTCYPERQ